jgi:uncharacterized tellurite resistance protein B-like protein
MNYRPQPQASENPKGQRSRSQNAKRTGPPKRPATQQELELALTVVLVDIALADGTFDQREKETIYHGVESMYGSSRDHVIGLINEATVILSGLRGSSRFTALLRDNLGPDQRLFIVHLINNLVLSDGEEEGLEAYLRERYAKALGVTLQIAEPPAPPAANEK